MRRTSLSVCASPTRMPFAARARVTRVSAAESSCANQSRICASGSTALPRWTTSRLTIAASGSDAGSRGTRTTRWASRVSPDRAVARNSSPWLPAGSRPATTAGTRLGNQAWCTVTVFSPEVSTATRSRSSEEDVTVSVPVVASSTESHRAAGPIRTARESARSPASADRSGDRAAGCGGDGDAGQQAAPSAVELGAEAARVAAGGDGAERRAECPVAVVHEVERDRGWTSPPGPVTSSDPVEIWPVRWAPRSRIGFWEGGSRVCQRIRAGSWAGNSPMCRNWSGTTASVAGAPVPGGLSLTTGVTVRPRGSTSSRTPRIAGRSVLRTVTTCGAPDCCSAA